MLGSMSINCRAPGPALQIYLDPTPTVKKKKLLIVAASVLCVTGVLAVFGQRLTSRKEGVPNDSYGLYYRDSNGVYLREPRDCGWLGCFGADLRSEAGQYKKIRFADPKTFQILQEPTRDGSDSGEILARDATHLFYGGEYVPSGDVQTLKVFGSHAKDKNNLYFHGMVINGIDIPSANLLGRDFITDKRGLYVANSVPPRKAALIDAPTFQIFTSISSVKGKDYFAEDKYFHFYSHGGTYAADPKPNTADFKTLGCDYYLFQGRVFYSIYELKGADPASFRVLGKPSGPAGSCNDFYAIDSSHRYEFDYRVSPDDNYRNRQIDLLLATPADRKAMSSRVTYTCIPQLRLGVNFGYQRHDRDPSPAGSIRLQVYQEARLMEGQLLNADGQWQPLP